MTTGFVTKNLYEFRLETLNSKFFFSIVRSLEESKLGNHKQSGLKNRARKMKTKTKKTKRRKDKNLENSSWKKAQPQKPYRSYLINLQ